LANQASLFLAFSASFSALLLLCSFSGFWGRLGLGPSAALLCLTLLLPTPFPPFFLGCGFFPLSPWWCSPLPPWWCSPLPRWWCLLANLAFNSSSFFPPAVFFFSSSSFFFNNLDLVLANQASLFLAFSASFSALLLLCSFSGFWGRLGLGPSAALLCLTLLLPTPFPPFFLGCDFFPCECEACSSFGGFSSFGAGVGTGTLPPWWCLLANFAFNSSSFFEPAVFFFSSSSCFFFNLSDPPLGLLSFLAFSASFSALPFLCSFTGFFFLPGFTKATGGTVFSSWLSSSSADL